MGVDLAVLAEPSHWSRWLYLYAALFGLVSGVARLVSSSRRLTTRSFARAILAGGVVAEVAALVSSGWADDPRWVLALAGAAGAAGPDVLDAIAERAGSLTDELMRWAERVVLRRLGRDTDKVPKVVRETERGD